MEPVGEIHTEEQTEAIASILAVNGLLSSTLYRIAEDDKTLSPFTRRGLDLLTQLCDTQTALLHQYFREWGTDQQDIRQAIENIADQLRQEADNPEPVTNLC